MSGESIKRSSFGGRKVLPALVGVLALLGVCLLVMYFVEDNDSATSEQFDLNEVTYTVISQKNKQLEVSKYNSDGVYVNIPSVVNYKGHEYLVTSIGNRAFYSKAIRSVSLPETLVSIGDSSFSSCDDLVSINIPPGVESIGQFAFSYCFSLESVEIPDGLKKLGFAAFQHCEKLKELSVPISIDTVNTYKYIVNGGTSNTSVTRVITHVFGGCNSLKSLTFTPGTSKWYDYGKEYKETPWYQSRSSIETLIITEGVPAPKAGTFDGFKNLTKLKMPIDFDSVVDPSSPLFKDSKKIENIFFQKSRYAWCDYRDTYMYTPWYLNKSNIRLLTIQAGIYALPDGGFKGFDKLTTLGIPLNIDTIGDPKSPAFEGCTNIRTLDLSLSPGVSYKYTSYENTPWQISKDSLTHVMFTSAITNIGAEMFKGCTKLNGSTFPNGLVEIGDGAFQDCKSLSFANIPAGVKKLGNRAFQGCESLTILNICEGVTIVGDNAFAGCLSLPAVSFPDSVESIGKKAFYGCTNLETIMFGKGLKSIGKDAFQGFTFYDENMVELSHIPKNLGGSVFIGPPVRMVKQVSAN